MPSPKNPAVVVNPGPGRLPDSVLTASSYIFPGGSGGGSDAELQAHITNPLDAHMASAVGVNPIDPVTGQPILTIAGGPVDGENVLDFIEAAMDLFPVRPDTLGTEQIGVPNSGLPSWDILDPVGLDTGTAITGGFTRGTTMVPTHYLMGGPGTSTLSGMVYPADRGVLALYYCTGGDFAPGTTTLQSALYLGVDPAPIGIPSASFIETSRRTQQFSHVPSPAPHDSFAFTNRLPYLEDYGSPPPYANFASNFYRYQLGTLGETGLAIIEGDAGSYLLVHWRESYATSYARIAPFDSAQLTTTNCYNAVPVAPGDFDHGDIATLCRHNIHGNHIISMPTVSVASVVSGTPTTNYLSGVQFYDSTLAWNLTVDGQYAFDTSYYTGTVASGADLPIGFESAQDPVVVDLTRFGGQLAPAAYYRLSRASGGPLFSHTDAPQPTDHAILECTQGITSLHEVSPTNGYGQVFAYVHTPFAGDSHNPDSVMYLYNSCPQAIGATHSTAVVESFDDEAHRYINSAVAGFYDDPLKHILPVGTDHRAEATLISTADSDLQVIGSQLVYPKTDFGASEFRPLGQPDYSAVLAADPPGTLRRYVRAFNTGLPRNTGKLHLQGISYNDLLSTAASPITEMDGHTGGVLVQIKLPGVTEWLDVGRAYGLPDLNVTLPFRGCATGVSPSDPALTDFELSYCTGTAFTSPNSLGEFIIWVRVTIAKTAFFKSLDAISWEAP